MPWLAGTLAYPITTVLSAGNSLGWYLGHILILQLVSFVWIHLQRESLTGGPFMAYAESLPISPRILRRTNLIMLLGQMASCFFLSSPP